MAEEEKGFEVRDRRKVTADEAGAAPEKPEEGRAHGDLPPIDFISFISSLAATALMHLGERIAPDQPDMKSLPAAKQMIDLLDLLKEKTKGNLDREETEMMEAVLYNLKMRFVREPSDK